MAKKKNYLSNEELKEEILKCIDEGFENAKANGFIPDDNLFINNHPDNAETYDDMVSLGFNPERSNWVQHLRNYNPEKIQELIDEGKMTQEDASSLAKQMVKPVASNKLGKMFQLIVNNVSRSFYWSNPDDGQDCKANALFDLCSGFWKYEPVDSNGKSFNAFAFCSQIAYFGIAGAHRILHPKKYNGTISISCLDENGKAFDLYNI